ncbi:hypothetical protein FDP41_005427 [Naegleria fowleri]|uniref:Mitochondrial processing peptidase beta subunit n=1 Tax=Naegleria fowleri TaxID=5763 RepID=A0A6A5BBY5_NAEFO|nr:uncharacterized protein FDP41_005427 [Naegleria fowleri]KAF0975433.1 hypothetical protein FDP41_005427 [Naegleria fowleri]CAG4715518.1 unnamed protein product [Naegleria fowleri]
MLSKLTSSNKTLIKSLLHHQRRGYATSAVESVLDQSLYTPSYHLPKELTKAAATRVTVLDNGFRVVTEPKVGETSAVGVFIGAGSRQENVLNNGVAHFLEHMYFKGTNKRSKVDIEAEHERTGSLLNAHTSREYTAFTIQCLKNNVDRSVNSLSEILLDSKLDEKEIDAERSVILLESEDVSQSVEECVYDELHRTAFPDSGLGLSILGPVENIKKLSRQQMIQYQKDFYTAERMVLVGTGNVDHDKLVKLAEQNFGHLQSATRTPRPLAEYQITPEYIGSDVRVETDEVNGLQGAIGFQGPGLASGDMVVINLIQFILGAFDISQGAPGKYAASNMAQYIGEQGWAQQVLPFLHGYSDTSLFGVKFVNDGGEDTDYLMVEILRQMTRLCYKVTTAELERAKNLLKLSVLSQYDGTLKNVLEEVGRQTLLFNRRPSAAEMFARIDAITVDDVKRVANTYIYDKEPVLVGVGYTKEFIDYSWARLFTSSIRL